MAKRMAYMEQTKQEKKQIQGKGGNEMKLYEINNSYDFLIAFKDEKNIDEIYSKLEDYFFNKKTLENKIENELNDYIAERNDTLTNSRLKNKLDTLATETAIKQNVITMAYVNFNKTLADLILLKQSGLIDRVCDIKTEKFNEQIKKTKAENNNLPIMDRIKTMRTPMSKAVLNVSFLTGVLD